MMQPKRSLNVKKNITHNYRWRRNYARPTYILISLADYNLLGYEKVPMFQREQLPPTSWQKSSPEHGGSCSSKIPIPYLPHPKRP
jgi:hypothetical protein